MRFHFFSDTKQRIANQAVGDFVSRRIWGAPDHFGPFCSMGIYQADRLIAGVIYHNWQPEAGTIEISCGANTRKWMTRDIISAALTMPFRMLDCQAILARHSEQATHIRRLWRSFGAEEYVIPRLRGKDEPAEAISVLTDDAWFSSHWSKMKELVDG